MKFSIKSFMGFENLPNQRSARRCTGINHLICTGPIKGFSDPEQLGQPLLGIFSLQQRPIGILVCAFKLFLNGTVEIDHKAAITQMALVFRKQNGTPARREDDLIKSGQFIDDFGLSSPEPGLALVIKDEGNTDPGLSFDLPIAVDKVPFH